jgi:hypothetical protein
MTITEMRTAGGTIFTMINGALYRKYSRTAAFVAFASMKLSIFCRKSTVRKRNTKRASQKAKSL